MNSKATYWFEQPYMPGARNLAVCPKIDPRDGRLCFSVPDSGIWGLHGELIKDSDDYFEFKCNDELMHARGGTYKFIALDIETFRMETYKWISQGEVIAKACCNTDDLYFWYRKNWPNMRLFEIDTYEMQENKRSARCTDDWNKADREHEA